MLFLSSLNEWWFLVAYWLFQWLGFVWNFKWRASMTKINPWWSREGVKWQLGLLIFGWENGISCTGTGTHQQRENRKWEWDYDLSWTATETMGFVLLDTGILPKFGLGNRELETFQVLIDVLSFVSRYNHSNIKKNRAQVFRYIAPHLGQTSRDCEQATWTIWYTRTMICMTISRDAL